jgi:hypothetical protein
VRSRLLCPFGFCRRSPWIMGRLDRQPVVASGSPDRVTPHDALATRAISDKYRESAAPWVRRGARSASANVGLGLEGWCLSVDPFAIPPSGVVAVREYGSSPRRRPRSVSTEIHQPSIDERVGAAPRIVQVVRQCPQSALVPKRLRPSAANRARFAAGASSAKSCPTRN